jgi:hypothetical protein
MGIMEITTSAAAVERWGMFEVGVRGRTDGNPFTDYAVKGTFRHKNETVEATGFYDGDGVYRVRCMPSFEGEYAFEVSGDAFEGVAAGRFAVTPPSGGNHGPVRVAKTYHFAYEDGTPHYSMGTTCYAWTHQSKALRDKTLESLKNGPFNKIRFCVFPKHYIYNLYDPETFPYKGTPCDCSGLTPENFQYSSDMSGNSWDFTRFNPAHFQRLEYYIAELMKLGVEADIIVMHPYDRWGFSQMTKEQDDLYWNYVVNRFSAYRNVWWSLANEHDFMRNKTIADWERYAAIICRQDPYHHLRSIHNGSTLYDHARPWITHCSYQRVDMYKTAEVTDELRARYQKPVVLDEICYEGNIDPSWGNITGQEMVRRFWEGAMRGGYPGHGETFNREDGVLWWSHGGPLHGESPPRIAFLKKIMEETPGHGLKLATHHAPWGCVSAAPEESGAGGAVEYMICYFGFFRPAFRMFHFDDETSYRAEVIDTWNMTIEDAGVHKGKFRVDLPAREYMAVRIQRAE